MDLDERQKSAREKICLPLDGLATLEDIRKRVELLSPVVGLFKIGKETFTRFGPEAVRLVQGYGSDIFLDLKFHDIPNTVKGASKAASELGVKIFNVHASGGKAMMEAAVAGAKEAQKAGFKRPKIIGVTVLTSIDKETLNNDLNVPGDVKDQVLRLALMAKEAGLDGIVCSGADLGFIKDKLPEDFLFVTPGIKGPNTSAGADQKRVFTPRNAIEDGSSILVIGRAITGADDPVKAALEVIEDII